MCIIISIKKQSTCSKATHWFELFQFTCCHGVFGKAFHFCHTPIPLENPLMNVTRVILMQKLSQWQLRNEIRLRQLDAPSALSPASPPCDTSKYQPS